MRDNKPGETTIIIKIKIQRKREQNTNVLFGQNISSMRLVGADGCFGVGFEKGKRKKRKTERQSSGRERLGTEGKSINFN